jgi:predicted RNase H-like HicB family nuclease
MAWHVAKILSVQGAYKVSFVDFPSINVQREGLEDALAEAGDRLQSYVSEMRAMGIMPPKPGRVPPALQSEAAGDAQASIALFEVKEIARESSAAPAEDLPSDLAS